MTRFRALTFTAIFLFICTCDSASWNKKFVLDDQSGSNGGLCQQSFPCETLDYAIQYITEYQQDSNNVTIIMDVDLTQPNVTNSTYQKWNSSLSISDSDANYSSSYTIRGQGSAISLVEIFGATITNDAAVYINSQYGVDFEFSDFRLSNGDTTYDRHFIDSVNNLDDGSYVFRNIIFDGLTSTDDFIYDYNSGSNYGRSLVLFEDCVIMDHSESNSFVEQRYSGGISMENVIMDSNTFGNIAFYIYYRYPYDSNHATYSTSDLYFKNVEIRNSNFGSSVVYDYYSYTDGGSWDVSNILISNSDVNGYFLYARSASSSSYIQTFTATNISVSNSYFGNYLIYLSSYGSGGVSISNIIVEDCDQFRRVAYLSNIDPVYVSDGDIIFRDIKVRNVTGGYHIFRMSSTEGNLVGVYDINATNASFSSGAIQLSWTGGDYDIQNLFFKNVDNYGYFLQVQGSPNCYTNYSTYERHCRYRVDDFVIENFEAIDSGAAYGIILLRAVYFEATNIRFSSTRGLDFEGSYTSGIWSMDFLHVGTTKVENLTMTDTIITESVYSQYGWKEAYVDGIVCDNVHTDNFWVYFEFYNIGKWKNYVQNIYFNGHYEDNDMDSIMTYWNCTGYNCKYWAQGIFYLYYDGDASEPSGGAERRRRSMLQRLRQHNELDDDNYNDRDRDEFEDFDEDLNFDEEFHVDQDAASSETQRKLLFWYEMYYNSYDENYTMTNCSENMDVYRNVTLIDNAINGPLVMMDIDTNDCDMIFDNWYVQKTVNLLNSSWNSENANSEGGERSGDYTSYNFGDYAYGEEGGEYNYFLRSYRWYYQYRVNYPDIDSGYIPPPLFFVYQYHDKNLGVVRIENSRFENNDGFPIVSCGAYSYCNIVIKNCFFKDNVFEYGNTTYYNAIWMDDNSFGNVKIYNSRFIGGYDEQGGDYTINWLYNPNTNSTFECNNCTISPPTSAPTEMPSARPSVSPTMEPSEQPTEIPTPLLSDVAISVSIEGEISSDLDEETAEDIISRSTEKILDEAEDGPYVYEDVTVEVTTLTTEQVDANVYVSETDISQEEFVELVESDLAAAIEEEDTDGYFGTVGTVEASTELATEEDGNNKSSNFPWEWVILAFGIVLAIVIAGGIYDFFCVNKVDKATKASVVASMNNNEPGATPGGTNTTQPGAQVMMATPGATGYNTSTMNMTNTLESEPALPKEAELVVVDNNSAHVANVNVNNVNGVAQLPDQPQVNNDYNINAGVGNGMGFATNGGQINAEMGDHDYGMDHDDDDDVLVGAEGPGATGGPGEQYTPGTTGGGEGAYAE